MRKQTGILILVGGVGTLGTGLLARTKKARRAVRTVQRALRRRLRHVPGQVRGLDYKLHGRHPDEQASDLVLADRIRSSIGPIEKELDLPRIHVMVNDHVAILHGEVSSQHDTERLVGAIGEMAGVTGVESFLHVGLLASDTRPSTGRALPAPPSEAHKRLTASAAHAGAASHPGTAVRTVLSMVCEQIPATERAHVLAHLPHDVRLLADPPLRRGTKLQRTRRTADLFDALAADSDIDVVAAEKISVAILADLVRLVPEERSDIDATLPTQFRELWRTARSVAEHEAGLSPIEINLLEHC